MVIQHNISAVNAYRNLNNNTTALNKNLEKLSSGYRINRAADDAAGLAISESMRSKIAGLDQSVNNANDGIGLIQTVEGALTETHSMLQRMTTLATQAANGTYASKSGTTARENIKAEMNELASEISRIANHTEYNGLKLLTSDATKIPSLDLQIGPTSAEKLSIKGSTMTAKALKLDGIASNMMTVKGANAAITKITSAINKVSAYRATLGAKQNRLEHTINNLKVTSENVTSAESRIRDTDMASEMAAYTKNNVLVQAATSMLAQANQSGSSVLSLLQ